MRSQTSGSRSNSPVSLSTKTAIGTPQARWRETHQSGRVSIIERMRLRPRAGTQRVASIAASAFSRSSPGPSIGMNHWGVSGRSAAPSSARSADSCGRACRAASSASPSREDAPSASTGSAALKTWHAREARRRRRVGAVLGHRVRHVDAVLLAQLEVVLAVAGAMWTRPVPCSVVTKSPARSGTAKS